MRRRWADVSIAVSGVAVAAVSGAVSRAADVPDLEADVFHMVNDAPDALYPILWPLMQYGTFATIPVVAVVALVVRRWWFATATLLAGISVYLLAKGVKLVVDRGRPAAEIDDVRHLRGIGRLGYGFPSGHAAVSAALATIAWAYLPGAWRRAAVVLAAIVSIARVYVGAHLPLDVVGGAALGVLVASAVNLVLGVPARRTRADTSHVTSRALERARVDRDH